MFEKENYARKFFFRCRLKMGSFYGLKALTVKNGNLANYIAESSLLLLLNR